MQNLNRGSYTIARDEVVAEGADLRVSILTLAAGRCVPWHVTCLTASNCQLEKRS